VICPAEQTCVVDQDIYDTVVAEFERMGAQVLTEDQVAQLSEFAFGGDDKMQLEAVGLSAPELARRAGFEVDPATKPLLAPLPAELGALGRHPSSTRS
jgi:acetaldehyde dehydrogenase / alcohol dehydrogenase